MGIPYNLNKPCKIYPLSNKLREISGIQAINHQKMVCVEDEHLNLYLFDPEQKKTLKFGQGKSGDAEDIVIISKTAYILTAGKPSIYIFSHYSKSMKNPEKIDLRLKPGYDPEGLCYLKNRNLLLIACKGSPESRSLKRKVFAVDLDSGKRLKQPFLTIDCRQFKTFKPGKTFNPSGIALHPRTGDIYMIGSQSLNLMIRMDSKGKKLKGEQKLSRKIFPQPEGIDFLENGDILIASEGKNGQKAKIFHIREKR